MRVAAMIIVMLFGALLAYAALDFPPWGDPSAPASVHVSPYYIEQAMNQTSVPRMGFTVIRNMESR